MILFISIALFYYYYYYYYFILLVLLFYYYCFILFYYYFHYYYFYFYCFFFIIIIIVIIVYFHYYDYYYFIARATFWDNDYVFFLVCILFGCPGLCVGYNTLFWWFYVNLLWLFGMYKSKNMVVFDTWPCDIV